jgi:clan AA aspartic protease (TIGR02281 family)
MFQNIFQISLSLMAGVLIGWNFHIFYIALEPKKIITDIKAPKLENKIAQTIIKKDINKSKPLVQKNKTILIDNNETNSSQDNFEILLKNGKFDEAMVLYSKASESKLKNYRLILKVYFYDNATKYPKRTIEEILQYIEIEPKSKDIQIYLSKLYREKKEFQKALEILFELKDNHESKIVDNELNTTIESYISHLKNTKDFTQLITFLEDLIARVDDKEHYTLILAQLYIDLEDFEESKKILEDIDDNSIYAKKVKKMFQEIKEKEKELQHYRYVIPLHKMGSQFAIDILIEGTPLTLLLDTGASYTFVNEDKLPSLNLGKEIFLNTAGGVITAHFAIANSLILGDLELNNFPITVAPFAHKDADGLLGMNFFNQFDFKINQNRGLLYLSEKK